MSDLLKKAISGALVLAVWIASVGSRFTGAPDCESVPKEDPKVCAGKPYVQPDDTHLDLPEQSPDSQTGPDYVPPARQQLPFTLWQDTWSPPPLRRLGAWMDTMPQGTPHALLASTGVASTGL